MRDRLRAVLIDVVVVLGWFLVLGVVGALVWWQVTDLPRYTRTADGAVLDQVQLARQFGTDGWFFAIAAIGGVLSGLALTWWRRRDPLVVVLLLVVGGALASAVMAALGQLLGPADPRPLLDSLPTDAHAAMQLRTHAHGVLFVWPMAALAGAALVLFLSRVDEPAPAAQPVAAD
jgi:hypothetical protein